MVHGKGIGFLWSEGKSDAYCHAREKYERVTNAQCDLFHSVIVSKRNARFIGGSFWANGDRKTVLFDVLSWGNGD